MGCVNKDITPPLKIKIMPHKAQQVLNFFYTKGLIKRSNKYIIKITSLKDQSITKVYIKIYSFL